MENLETKVSVSDLEEVRSKCRSLGARKEWVHQQVDTYFNASKGRLKLREEGDTATLISYCRPDIEGMRTSQYHLLSITDGAAFKAALSDSLGILVQVEKERELWLYEHTRIHLDKVNELGSFVELETVLGPIDSEQGAQEHAKVLADLAIGQAKAIGGSYSQLLIEKRQEPSIIQ